MKLELFISNRFNRSERSGMARPAIKIAIVGVAIGLAVMLVAIAVIVGFKREVRNQIIGFGCHIQVLPFNSYDSPEEKPLYSSFELEESIKTIKGVSDIQHIANKPGILHTDDGFQGVLLKGVDTTFNWSFFSQNLIEGETLQNKPDSIANGAIISHTIAKYMNLRIGDSFTTYFVSERLKARKFTVMGIYQTTFNDYDKLYIITDLKNIQQLNNWQENEYSSLEILISDYSKLSETTAEIYNSISFGTKENRILYRVETIETLTPQIFGWLTLLDMNAIVILVLMLVVSGFCVISGMLILILERSSTIGLLKSLGANNWTIRKIFLAQAFNLVVRGIIWGNAIGLVVVGIQYFTHLIPLDPQSYYVDFVPVYLTWQSWLLLNLGTAIAAITMLVAPSYLVTRISPAESMRKE